MNVEAVPELGRRRGQPLVGLALILVLWTGARAMLWDPYEPQPFGIPPVRLVQGEKGPPHDPVDHADEQTGAAVRDDSMRSSPGTWPGNGPRPTQPVPFAPWQPPVTHPRADALEQPRARPMDAAGAAGMQMLWMAALSRAALPLASIEGSEPAVRPAPASSREDGLRTARRRWSGDGWILLRRGGNGRLGAGISPATYGASQIGAVARYRLALGDARAPTAFVRASAALQGSRQEEVALGLSVRPVPALPVVAAAEMRVTRQRGGTVTRPAAYLVTQVAPITLPHDARAEFYAQAGYVGGAGATAFVYGQVRVDARVANIADRPVRAGVGAWGGAQEGAERLDVGPTASVSLPLGNAGGARLAVDWRLRLAGDASPRSGPALTLSAGF